MKKLTRDFYNQKTVLVAKSLLGQYLVSRIGGLERIGRIVEVEAYIGPHDLASHCSKGMTKRTQTMFGPPGHLYIYMIYGMYFCTNIVTEAEGHGSAVLLRALEPIKNIQEKTSGPGLLSRALQFDKTLNGSDLLGNQIFITEPDRISPFTIKKRPRVGVAYAKAWAKKLLRFYIEGNAYISKP